MDTQLTQAVTGLGGAALATAGVQALKSYGLAPKQWMVFVWALAISVGVQMLYAVQAGGVTSASLATAAITGLTGAFAAGGIHDHVAAPIQAKIEGTGNGGTTPDPLSSINPGNINEAGRAINAIVSAFRAGTLNAEAAQKAVDSYRLNYPDFSFLVPPGFPSV